MIDVRENNEKDINILQAEADMPHSWQDDMQIGNTIDAQLLKSKPAEGMAHTLGHHAMARALINNCKVQMLLDSGASCSIVGKHFLSEIVPDWQEKIMPSSHVKFSGVGSKLHALGVTSLPVIFPHVKQSIRINTEFVVMENVNNKYFILGAENSSQYGFDILHSKERYFTIVNNNKSIKFALSTLR